VCPAADAPGASGGVGDTYAAAFIDEQPAAHLQHPQRSPWIPQT
jgi:hypothetical protein